MPRASDLDTIAPDDPLVAKSQPVIHPSPPKPSPKPKKSKPKVVSSRDQKFRQKVYQLIEGTTKHPLSAFLARPKVFTFDFRDDDEEIILVLRRHWFTNLSWILVAVLMLILPLVLPFISVLDFFPAEYQFILAIFWYLLAFAIAFEKFLAWYFNVFILTEERVIDIDFFNLLDKKVSEAKIGMIQDVTSKTAGVSQTLFNYGNILIQTASEIPVIVIDKIPNPNLVLQVLQQMRSEEEQEALEGRLK